MAKWKTLISIETPIKYLMLILAAESIDFVQINLDAINICKVDRTSNRINCVFFFGCILHILHCFASTRNIKIQTN